MHLICEINRVHWPKKCAEWTILNNLKRLFTFKMCYHFRLCSSCLSSEAQTVAKQFAESRNLATYVSYVSYKAATEFNHKSCLLCKIKVLRPYFGVICISRLGLVTCPFIPFFWTFFFGSVLRHVRVCVEMRLLVSSCPSVPPYICVYQLNSHWMDFREIEYS